MWDDLSLLQCAINTSMIGFWFSLEEFTFVVARSDSFVIKFFHWFFQNMNNSRKGTGFLFGVNTALLRRTILEIGSYFLRL